jgi:hypothetical protein
MTTLAALATIALALTGPAGAAAAAQEPTVEITVDHNQTAATVGQVITIQTHLTNPTNTPTGRLLAHINVASTDPETYVDLEDWSTDVTRSLAPVPPTTRRRGRATRRDHRPTPTRPASSWPPGPA